MARLSYDRVNDEKPERPQKRDTAYMPMPDHCGRGSQPVFDGIKHVDLVICYYYCTERLTCRPYREYTKDLGWDGKARRR